MTHNRPALALLAALLCSAPSARCQQTSTARQRAAVQKACQAGALSPEECQQKLAALSGSGGSSATATPPTGGAGATPPGGRDIAGATTWRHPQGLYSLSVPPGWNVDTSSNNPKLTNGDTWAIFETSASNSTPMQVAQKDAGQMQPMLSNWKVDDQGSFQTRHNHGAAGITASASVPARGGPTQRTLLFWTQTDGQQHFVTMTASMDAVKAQQTGLLLMQVFNSLKFSGE